MRNKRRPNALKNQMLASKLLPKVHMSKLSCQQQRWQILFSLDSECNPLPSMVPLVSQFFFPKLQQAKLTL